MDSQEKVPFFKLVSSLQLILDLFAEHFGISLVLLGAQYQEVTIPSNLASFCFDSNISNDQCRICYQEAIRKFVAANKDELLFTCHKEMTIYICSTNITVNYQPLYLMARLIQKQELLPYCAACIRSITILPLNIIDESTFDKNGYVKNSKYGVYGITRREYMVLHDIAKGFSNKEIANSMNISTNTVKLHVSHIMKKLHAENRTEAVYSALRKDLL
jgi:DNA-binding CsgD family transcriptional regulator